MAAAAPARVHREDLTGPDGDGSRPLATEFLIEARDGGTCVLRVVSALADDNDGWEDLVEDTRKGWRTALVVLRAYLTHFAGQPAADFAATVHTGRPYEDRSAVLAAFADALGLTGRRVGDAYRAPPGAPALTGVVEHADDVFVLVRATRPGPGLYAFSAFWPDGANLTVNMHGHRYGPDAVGMSARDSPLWTEWLSELDLKL